MILNFKTGDELIKFEELLSEYKVHHNRQGVEFCYRIIREKFKDCDKVRESGRDEYYEGYDKAVRDILAAIRDDILFKK